jgi:peptidyl-prolyl cis-trans isomerase SurA
MKRFCSIALLLLSTVLACQAAAESRNFIAAIVNSSIITFREVQDFTAQAIDVLYRTYGNNPQVLDQKERETFSDGLEQLIENQLILDDFKAAGGTLPDSFIDDEIKDRIRSKFGDRVTLTKTLQAQGVTFETFRKRTHDEIVLKYMQQKNISSAIIISPQKIERFYAANLNHFRLGDQVKLRMIVLNRSAVESVDEVKKLAQEIRAKVDQGSSFSEMASVYSTGSQRQEGGDWGWVERDKLNKGLSDVAFGLNAGQRSPVIALARQEGAYWTYTYDKAGVLVSARKYTDKDVFVEEKKYEAQAVDPNLPAPQEFYLMMIEDKQVARVKGLPEVREEIEKTLLTQERARLRKTWIERLKNKAFVRFF